MYLSNALSLSEATELTHFGDGDHLSALLLLIGNKAQRGDLPKISQLICGIFRT